MPGFSSYDAIISAISSGQQYERWFQKVTGTMQGAGFWHSLARIAGMPAAVSDGGAGSGTPGSGGTALTSANGNLVFPDQSPSQKALVTFGATANVAGALMIYDRLVHVSGVSVATTGSKNVGSAALPRYSGTSAADVQAWLEVTTATTTTQAVVNVNSYTDQDGNAAQSGGNLSFPAAATVANTFVGPLPVAAGDLGFRSIETINVGTAASAGVVQVVLMKPLAVIPIPANTWVERDLVLQLSALPRIFDGASLNAAWLASATTTTTITGQIRVAYA